MIRIIKSRLSIIRSILWQVTLLSSAIISAHFTTGFFHIMYSETTKNTFDNEVIINSYNQKILTDWVQHLVKRDLLYGF